MSIPLKFVLDPSVGRIVPSFDSVDMIELEKLGQERLKICQSCENFFSTEDPEIYTCDLCGCNLKYKIKKFYPFDGDGKASISLTPQGEYITVCPIKKW
jgi:hypothetical protein